VITGKFISNMKKVPLFLVLLFLTLFSGCKQTEEYEVYSLKYFGGWKIQAKEGVIGADPADSIHGCEMFWLLKSRGGKNILVDAGYIDSIHRDKNYIRPDSLLQKLEISPQDISDIILTHPHYDHIGGITLFPEAHIWMQKDDYDYFISRSRVENGDTIGFNKIDVQNIISVNSQGRLTLVNGDNTEIMPGIKVFTGSKHTFENQYLLVNSNSKKDKILLASDAIWFYLNLEKLLPITLCRDTGAYVQAIKRMKTLVSNQDLIIPGHDDKVFSKFPKVQDRIVRIKE
jgi:glyoxylase-like metal-dependent hydrolase (beta-lactamase superfamily II)